MYTQKANDSAVTENERGLPIQIVDFKIIPDRLTHLSLEKNSLLEILSEVGDRPIYLLSIAGASRQGKSFLLTILLHMLENLSTKKEVNWEEILQLETLKGFHFKNGTKRQTVGFWLWSKPFIFKKSDNSEIAVLLMDTQGVFDTFTTKRDWSMIVGLSLLTSSCLIYNLFNNMQEDSLEIFHNFMEFGLLSLGEDECATSVFQKLIILIRDWNFPQTFPYGPLGGKSFLAEKLDTPPGMPKELQKVRSSIKQCFEERECFLMPNPGDATKDDNFNGKLSTLNPDFLKNMKKFASTLLNVDDMQPLKIGGEIIQGTRLITYMEKYITVFNKQDLPKPMSLFEATQEAQLDSLVSNCSKKVLEVMTALANSYDFLSKKDLTTQFDMNCKEAVVTFNANAKSKNKDLLLKYQRSLANDLRHCRKEMEELNELKKIKFLDARIEQVQSVYKGNLDAQILNQTYSEQQLNQLLSTHNLIALEEFGKVCGKRNAEFYEEAIPKLQSALSNLDDNYSKTNSAKLKLAEETARRVITNLVCDYDILIQMSFSKNMTKDELLQKHQKCEDMMINKFQQQVTFDNQTILEKYLNELKANISAKFRTIAFELKHTQDDALEKAMVFCNSAIDSYTESMQKMISLDVTAALLDKEHNQYSTQSINKLLPIYQFCNNQQAQEIQSRLQKEINNIYASICRQVESAKLDFHQRWTHEIRKIVENHCKTIQDLIFKNSAISDEQLQHEHEDAVMQLKKTVPMKDWIPENEWPRFTNATLEAMNNAFKEVMTTRSINIEHIELDISSSIDTTVQHYISKVQRSIEQTYNLDGAQLQQIFCNVKQDAVQKLEDSCKSIPKSNSNRIVSLFIQKFEKNLDILQKSFDLQLEETQKQARGCVDQCTALYKSEMKGYCQFVQYPDETSLNSIHEVCKTKLLHQLDLMLKGYGATVINSEYKDAFLAQAASEYEELKHQVLQQIQKVKDQISKMKEHLKPMFKARFEEAVTSINNEQQLRLIYNNLLAQITSEFENKFPQTYMSQFSQEKQGLLKELQCIYDKIYENFCEKVSKLDSELRIAIREAAQEYSYKMEIDLGLHAYVEDDQLMTIHNTAEQMGIHTISRLPSVTNVEAKIYKDEFIKIVRDKFEFYKMENISKRESVMQSIGKKIQNLKDFVVAELSTMALPEVNFKLMKKEYIQKCKEDLREEYNLLPDEMLVNYVEPKLETALTEAYNIWISKEPSSLEIDLAIIHAKTSYNNLMEQQTAVNKHEHPSILKSKHLTVCKQVITEFEKAVKQTPTVIMKLNEVLNEAFHRYEDKNKLRAADLLDAAIGIDLGTTYSCVSFYKNGRTEMIPDRNTHRNVTPSYIQFLSKDEVIVGETAKDQAVLHPENTIFDAKRLIGRWFDDESVQKDIKSWPFKVINCNNRPKIEVHGEAYLPEAISAKLLKKLKSDAEKHLQCDIKNAVITVPAYFSEAQKRATKLAGETAGLNVLGILNEPTAAAIAYSLNYADEKQRNLFVYDLGGGTFDVSVLVVKGGKIEVKGVNGDTHLGGEDFDTEMLKYCISEFERVNNITLDTSNESIKNSRLQRIRHACEKQKQNLSVAPSVFVTLGRMHQDLNMHVEITRETFNRINEHHFNKTIQIVEKSLKEAGIPKSEVNDIVLVGGSTRIPKVQELLKQFFDGKSLNTNLNPDEVVASGAAIYAALRTGSKARELGHIEFSDVTPLSLGIEVKGGGFSPIIQRNSKVPLSKMETYYTTRPNQTSVQIVVYEGEDPIAKKNNLLGTFNLNGVPPGPSGREEIEVTISCDKEGLLTVTAVCKSNGINQEITIEADRHGVSETGAQ